MSDTNYELEIFKLVESDLVTERGWVSETEFYVWVSYLDIQEMNSMWNRFSIVLWKQFKDLEEEKRYGR